MILKTMKPIKLMIQINLKKMTTLYPINLRTTKTLSLKKQVIMTTLDLINLRKTKTLSLIKQVKMITLGLIKQVKMITLGLINQLIMTNLSLIKKVKLVLYKKRIKISIITIRLHMMTNKDRLASHSFSCSIQFQTMTH